VLQRPYRHSAKQCHDIPGRKDNRVASSEHLNQSSVVSFRNHHDSRIGSHIDEFDRVAAALAAAAKVRTDGSDG
jgi:hypothetical protein